MMFSLVNMNLNLSVNAEFIDLNGGYNQITKVYPFYIDVSLNQQGFPFDADSQIKSSPVVIDLTNDGNNEIIFGDYSGLVHVLDHNGNPILEDFSLLIQVIKSGDLLQQLILIMMGI